MTPLIDSRVVAQTFALRREVALPHPKSDGLAVEPAIAYGSVLRGPDGAWMMWHLGRPFYCQYFATSADGLAWRRPSLDLVAPQIRAENDGPNAFMGPGQKDANGRWLVHDKGPEGFCVLDAELTPHPAARGRYMAMYLARGQQPDGTWEKGLHLAHSEDGMHWLADERSPVIPGWRDTANQLLYDARIGRYVWYGRPEAHVTAGVEANRLIARAESEDLVTWTPERTVLDTDDIDADPMELIDEVALRGSVNEGDDRAHALETARLTEATTTGDARPCTRGRNRQWYAITVFPYADLTLALGALYDVPSGDMWVELLHSFDGIDWRRESRRVPFLPHRAGDMRTAMSTPPVPVGDELWIYSGPRGRNHHGQILTGAKAGIEIHALSRDRWVAYGAGTRQGELLTQPLRRGERIALNARTRAGGWIRTAVLDAAGKEIAGFTLDESLPLTGDGLAMTPGWAGGRTATALPEQHRIIRLRIALERADLFAFDLGTGKQGTP